jgi:hypothetical protein
MNSAVVAVMTNNIPLAQVFCFNVAAVGASTHGCDCFATLIILI